jgi:hypothetical protein
MSFDDQIDNTKNADLKRRIRLASIIAAIDVQGEAVADMTPAVYAKRAALANKVIQTAGLGTPGDDVNQMFTWAVCSNVAITADSPDGDIQFSVNTVWSDCAGVTGTD